VDASSSDSWGLDSAVFLSGKAGADQGTISCVQQDRRDCGGNSESLALPRLAAASGVPVPRAVAAGTVSGGTGCDDGDLQIVPTGSPSGLTIAGDIDEFTFPTLAASLARLADGNGEIHLDLASVRYCDLAGLRALVGLAGGRGDRPQHDGRRVILHGLPSHLKTVLQILGWDSVPGLVI
jgi:anti-anti-sigma regulatory factor